MPEFPKSGTNYHTVKLPNGKWTVREFRTDGTKENLGEYDSKEEADRHERDLTGTVMSVEAGEAIAESRKRDYKNERLDKEKDRKKEENFSKQEALDVHNERLQQRWEELQRQKGLLTKHQQRRNERSP